MAQRLFQAIKASTFLKGSLYSEAKMKMDLSCLSVLVTFGSTEPGSSKHFAVPDCDLSPRY